MTVTDILMTGILVFFLSDFLVTFSNNWYTGGLVYLTLAGVTGTCKTKKDRSVHAQLRTL